MRYGSPGQFRGVRPLTVVEDRDDLLAAWLAPGTPVLKPVLASGADLRSVPLEERFTAPRKAVLASWSGPGILKLVPWGAAHSVWLFWHPDGRFWGWYVNLEEPHRRWDGGLDTRDNVLDIWVDAPRSWRLKDEDEFDVAVRSGRLTDDQAAAVQREAERVIALVEAWAAPFRDRWELWGPDPAWPLPALPERSDRLESRVSVGER